MLDFCVFTDCNATLKSEETKRNFSFMYGRKTALKVKDCTQKLINLFSVYCSTGSIKLQIYLCQLYKVDMDVPHKISLAQDITNAQLGLKTLLSFWCWSYCYVTRNLDETCWICRHWITRIPRQRTTKARQTYRQLPFENEENTDCHTAVQVCKRLEYFLERSMSGTELNYRNMYPMGLCM